MQTHQAISKNTWPTTQVTLLQRVGNRHDKMSWSCFVQTYGPLIQRYCLRRGLQEADAFDVVQDVLLQVSKHIGDFRYDAERGRFRNWLGTVTHHAILKNRAKSRRTGGTMVSTEFAAECLAREHHQTLGEEWEEAFNAHVYREAVRRLRSNFSQETWRAFEATFAEDCSPTEVADELRRSVGWVYQAKSQVLRRLREEILHLAEDSVFLNIPSVG